MAIVTRVGEQLARRIDRRRAATKAAAAVFAWTAAWATQGPFGSSALANECQSVTAFDCTCNFPWGNCREFDDQFCNGAQCGNQCVYDYQFYDSTACWCSKTCNAKNTGRKQTGYYKCCDCRCPSGNGLERCGCKRFYPAK
jgi:hypothetical protein